MTAGIQISGVTFTGGSTIGSGTGGGGSTYTAAQSASNSGSNGIHIDTSYTWASTVPVGATIVADGYGTLTVVSIYTPTDPGNFSGNWWFIVTPNTYNFAGGTNLTFSW